MLRKWNARMQMCVVLIVGICSFVASSQGENSPISDDDVNIGKSPSRYTRHNYGGDIPRVQRQIGLPAFGPFGLNLFEKVATDTATVLGSVNQQIHQLSRPFSAGQPGINFGIGVNSEYPGHAQNPYAYGLPQSYNGAPTYGYPPQIQGPLKPYGRPPPHGGYRPDSHEQHNNGYDHGHGHGHGHDHGHDHGTGLGYGHGQGHGNGHGQGYGNGHGHNGQGNGYASGYEHSHYHGNDHGHGGTHGHGNIGDYGQGHNHGQNAFRPQPNQVNGQGNNQGIIAPQRIPELSPTNTGDLNRVPVYPTPAPPVPPSPAPAPPTVSVQPQPAQPAPPPPPPTSAAPTTVAPTTAAPTPAPFPSSTTEDIYDVTYDIDIRGEFETNQTRRRRQLFPNLFNSIGNIVQTGVNLANPANYQQPGQQPFFPTFGGFGQRPIFGQPSSQPQPGFQPQPQQHVTQPPPTPPTTGPSFYQSHPQPGTQPASQPTPPTVSPSTQAPSPAPENPNPEPHIPELNLQNLGGTDFNWTPENIGAHRVRRDSDAIFFPDDEIFERPLPIRPPTNPIFKPVVKQPFSESQAGAQSQSQNIFGGFEQSSGSQSQSQSVQNALGTFNQNAAGSTSGNIATDGSSGQLSAANTMQQSFQTADSSGSKNSAQSQSANFDKEGNLALTSSNANTNSIREKDRFKEQSNAGSSSTLQNQHGSSSSNAQTNSETFLENGIQGSKNTASSQSQQTNKDGSVSGANANTLSNTFTGPNGLQGSSSSSQSSSFNQGQPGGGGASSSAMASSSAGSGTGGGSFSISGSFTGIPPFSAFPNLFPHLNGK